MRPLREGILAGMTFLLVSCIGLGLLYHSAARAQTEAVRTELSQLVRALAVQIDGDTHRTLSSPSQMGSVEHLRALAPMVAFHKATSDLIYVYTAILRDDVPYFVLGTDYLYRVPGDTLPPDPLMKRYEGNDPKLMEALRRHVVTVAEQPVREPGGSYMSAYAPLYDSHGSFVGVAGIDMRVRLFEERLSILRHMLVVALGVVTTLSSLAGMLVTRLRRRVAFAIARDRAAALELARAKTETDQLNEQLVIAAQTAERHADAALEASRAKSTFLATMSHEIRTPMNGVLGMAELLGASALDERQRRYLRTIQQSGASLLRIINDVLDFSKIEAGRLEVDSAPFSLREIAEDAVELLAPRAHAKGLALVCVIPLDLHPVFRGDGQRLRQVLINLLGNAVKFTDQGHVSLRIDERSATATASNVRIEVEDTGIGIHRENQEGIFRPFSQEDGSTTRRYGGTGLGLAISRELVTLMGGELSVRSTPGLGSTFTLSLPLTRDRSALRADYATRLAGIRALVVEGNSAALECLLAQLEGAGAEVLAANSAAAAHARAQTEAPESIDIVLLDQRLPDMDGAAFASALRSMPAVGDAPLILMSSEEAAVADSGPPHPWIFASLAKPVRQARLLSTVAAALTAKGRGTTAATTLSLPALSLDCAVAGRAVLLVEDNPVNLEVGLAMLENLGAVVTRAHDGSEALTAFRQQSFDVVLMDCQMPEMDGYQATRAIRLLEQRNRPKRHTPIVALTANALVGDEQKCREVGMDGYLSKPFALEQLRTVLNSVLADAADAGAAVRPLVR